MSSSSTADARPREAARSGTQPAARDRSARPRDKAPAKKSSGFLMDLRYRNELPRPPVDPKFIKIPWRPEKLYEYRISTLEQHYKYRVHLEPVVGAPIHLIDPSTAEDTSVRLAPEDKHLLRRENDEVQDFYRSATDRNGTDQAPLSSFGNTMSARNLHESHKIRAGKHWLRKTEYIDNAQRGSIHNYASGLAENEKRLAELEKEQKMITSNTERLSKTERIEKSFQAAKETPVHQTDKSLQPIKVFSVLPNLDMLSHPLFQVHFMDENLLDDIRVGEHKPGQKRKRHGRAVEYTEEQTKKLGSSILEAVHMDEDDVDKVIGLLIPEGGDETSEDKDSDFDGESDDELMKPAAKGGAGGSKLRWVRDYVYRPQGCRPYERFALTWDKASLEAAGDVNNIIYGKVQFAEFQTARLEASRTQTDKYDVDASRLKRIKFSRRDFTDEERREIAAQLAEVKEASFSAIGESDDEDSDVDGSLRAARGARGSGDGAGQSKRRGAATSAPRAKSRTVDDSSSEGGSGSEDEL